MRHDPIMKSAGLSRPFIPMPPEEAAALLEARYGKRARLQRLITEKDDTFLVERKDGARYVAKISNPDETAGEISLEVDAIEHVAAKDPALPVPRVVRALDGGRWFEHEDDHGQFRKVRLLTYVPGLLMDNFPLSRVQRERSGMVAARMRLALADFTHPFENRQLPWDVKQLPKLAYLLDHVEASRRADVQTCIDRFLDIEGELSTCRRQVLHNDFTGSNVLVDETHPGFVTGVIDFGDVVKTYVAADLAVALLSHVPPSGNDDMLDGARDLLKGYLAVASLTETELRLLPHLVAARLCTRILITSWRSRQFPENAPYILRNMGGAWVRLNYFVSRPVHQLDESFL